MPGSHATPEDLNALAAELGATKTALVDVASRVTALEALHGASLPQPEPDPNPGPGNEYFEAMQPLAYASLSLRTQAEINGATQKPGPAGNTSIVYDPAMDAAVATTPKDLNAYNGDHDLMIAGPFTIREEPQLGDTFSWVWEYRWNEGMKEANLASDNNGHGKHFALMANDAIMGGFNTWWKYDINFRKPEPFPVLGNRWGICDGGGSPGTKYAGANITKAEPCAPNNNHGNFEEEGRLYRVVIHHQILGGFESLISVWREQEGGPRVLLYDHLQYRHPWNPEKQMGIRGLRVMWSPKPARTHGPSYSWSIRNVLAFKNVPIGTVLGGG